MGHKHKKRQPKRKRQHQLQQRRRNQQKQEPSSSPLSSPPTSPDPVMTSLHVPLHTENSIGDKILGSPKDVAVPDEPRPVPKPEPLPDPEPISGQVIVVSEGEVSILEEDCIAKNSARKAEMSYVQPDGELSSTEMVPPARDTEDQPEHKDSDSPLVQDEDTAPQTSVENPIEGEKANVFESEEAKGKSPVAEDVTQTRIDSEMVQSSTSETIFQQVSVDANDSSGETDGVGAAMEVTVTTSIMMEETAMVEETEVLTLVQATAPGDVEEEAVAVEAAQPIQLASLDTDKVIVTGTAPENNPSLSRDQAPRDGPTDVVAETTIEAPASQVALDDAEGESHTDPIDTNVKADGGVGVERTLEKEGGSGLILSPLPGETSVDGLEAVNDPLAQAQVSEKVDGLSQPLPDHSREADTVVKRSPPFEASPITEQHEITDNTTWPGQQPPLKVMGTIDSQSESTSLLLDVPLTDASVPRNGGDQKTDVDVEGPSGQTSPHRPDRISSTFEEEHMDNPLKEAGREERFLVEEQDKVEETVATEPAIFMPYQPPLIQKGHLASLLIRNSPYTLSYPPALSSLPSIPTSPGAKRPVPHRFFGRGKRAIELGSGSNVSRIPGESRKRRKGEVEVLYRVILEDKPEDA